MSPGAPEPAGARPEEASLGMVGCRGEGVAEKKVPQGSQK